jgi:hypothetical protein
MRLPIDLRIAKLAARMDPVEGELLMRSWVEWRTLITTNKMEAAYAEFRDRRELELLCENEQERVFDEDDAEAEDD